jgi:hypothetical protein
LRTDALSFASCFFEGASNCAAQEGNDVVLRAADQRDDVSQTPGRFQRPVVGRGAAVMDSAPAATSDRSRVDRSRRSSLLSCREA